MYSIVKSACLKTPAQTGPPTRTDWHGIGRSDMATLTNIPPLPALSGGPRHLSEAIADAITSAIAQGALHPGERLIEEAIAAQLLVSRVPLREAIRTLEAQGILVVTPNRGARVVSMDERTVANVQEARIAIERIACKG